MSPSASKQDRLERIDSDLVVVRERLARVEERMEAHDKASEARHQELVSALEELGGRMKSVEARAWKLAMGLALVGVGGGAGGAQLVQSLLGG